MGRRRQVLVTAGSLFAHLVAGRQVLAQSVPVILDTVLSSVNLEQEYAYQLRVVGGTAPFRWSVVSGDLPGGLTLDQETGQIIGTANTSGRTIFTVQVEDANGRTASRQYALAVTASGFRLEADTPSLVLSPGRTTVVRLRVIGESPSFIPISLNLVSSLPPEVVSSFEPNVLEAPANGEVSLAFAAGPSAPLGTYPLRVAAVSGQYSQFLPLNLVVRPPTPRLVRATPGGGPPGTRVRLSGADLAGAQTVTFNGRPAQFTAGSDSELTAVVPPDAASGPLAVTTRGGTATLAGDFVVPRHGLSLVPQNVAAATGSVVRVQIRLTGSLDVPVGLALVAADPALPATFSPDYLGPDNRTATLTLDTTGLVPGAYPLAVTAGEYVRTTATLRVLAPPPRLTRLAPLQGVPGTAFVLEGQGFLPGVRLRLGTLEVPLDEVTPSRLRGRIPPGAATDRLRVLNPDGQTAVTSSVFAVVGP
jgi:hypothetical protein